MCKPLPTFVSAVTEPIITVRNEVAKVMFLQAYVCPQGGGVCSRGVSAPRGGVSAPTVGGLVSQHALRQTPPGEMATAADGTHPTGMHFVFYLFTCLVLLGHYRHVSRWWSQTQT